MRSSQGCWLLHGHTTEHLVGSNGLELGSAACPGYVAGGGHGDGGWQWWREQQRWMAPVKLQPGSRELTAWWRGLESARQVVRGHKGSGASGEGGAAAAGLGGGERLAGVAISTPFDEEEQEKEESCSWGRVVSVREGMVRRLGPSRHPAELGFALCVKDRCVVEAGCLAY